MYREPLGLVCQTCGDEGFTNAFIYCVKCLRFVIHRYCLDVIPRTTDEFVTWFCEDCRLAVLPPKHDPSRFHKEDLAIKIPHVKTTKHKKKQKKGQSKKMKIVPLLPAAKDKVCYPEEEAAEPDHECISGPNHIKTNVLLGLEKGVFQKQSSESTQLDNCPLWKDESLQSQKENLTNSEHLKTTKRKGKRKKRQMKIVPSVAVGKDNVSCPEDATKPNGERAPSISCPLKEVLVKSNSGLDQIVPCVHKGVSQKQSSDSKNQGSAIPENEHLQSQKEDASNSAQLETIKHKKKQKRKPKKNQIKKKKTVSLVAGKEDEATKPNHECISPTNSPLQVNLDSGPNLITPCVLEKDVFQKQHSSDSAELDNNCCPLDKSVKRTSDATSVVARRKKHKTGNSIVEHSSCESTCSDIPLKHSVEEQEQEQGCEVKQSNKAELVSDSSSIEKELNNMTTEIETENQMHQEQGAYASQSAYLENNVHSIHYQPARPIIDPLWRGSFNIIQTDYNVFEGFVGHLSSKACARVRDEASTLPSLLCLEMQPKTALWPKSFLESLPSDENIALYFLPGSTRNKRDFEQLVNDMVFEELAMKATTKNAELLIFTSKVLPESYWRFQGSCYLWGVFRRKKNDDQSLAASNTSDNHGLSHYQVTSEKDILTRVMR